MSIFKSELSIYIDGGHKAKWGSWAFVVTRNGKIIFEAAGRESKTNSHRMEFQAAIEALSYLKPGASACIYSDSRTLIAAMQLKKRPMSNADQIQTLDNLTENKKITWKWIKAHSGIPFNERCDELCVTARERES